MFHNPPYQIRMEARPTLCHPDLAEGSAACLGHPDLPASLNPQSSGMVNQKVDFHLHPPIYPRPVAI